MMGKRIISIWWPRLAIERWAKTHDTSPDAAVVLTVEAAHGQMIHAATDAALEAGARIGARLTDARPEPGAGAMPADLAEMRPGRRLDLGGRGCNWRSGWGDGPRSIGRPADRSDRRALCSAGGKLMRDVEGGSRAGATRGRDAPTPRRLGVAR